MPLSANGFKNGKSMIMLPPPPPSPEKLSPTSNKLILDDFSTLPPPPPPIAIDFKNSPNKMSSSLPYKSGSAPLTATDMLEKSLRNLQVSEKEEFRTNAGKIISLMLESRLNDKDGSTTTDTIDNQTMSQKKPMQQNGNGTSIQMTVPQTKMIECKLSQNNGNNGKFVVSTSLTPLPQPIATTTLANVELSTFGQSMLKNDNDTLKKQNGNTLNGDRDTTNGNHINNGGVVFRNKESKLTTHARDRRSYIEKDQNVINNNNSINSHNNDDNVVVSTNNNSNNKMTAIAVGTTDKASELVDGKQPVCSCCNTKITR